MPKQTMWTALRRSNTYYLFLQPQIARNYVKLLMLQVIWAVIWSFRVHRMRVANF